MFVLYLRVRYLTLIDPSPPLPSRYDPATNKWRRVPDMTTPRRNAAGAMVHNCLYVVGGDDGITNLSTIEVFDPFLDKWRFAEGGLTQGRSYAGVAVIDKAAELLNFK